MPMLRVRSRIALGALVVGLIFVPAPGSPGGSVRAATSSLHLVYDALSSGRYQLYVKRPNGSRVLLVNDPNGSDFGAAVSPKAVRVAFTRRAGGNYDIYEVPIGGGKISRVTTSSAIDAFPAYSTSGKLAFQSNRAGNFDIYILSGGSVRQLTTSPAVDALPTWAPDESHIAFDSNRTGRYEITRMPTSAYGIAVTLTHIGSSVQPAWSPNGNEIAFASNRTGRWQIYEINPRTRVVTRLTEDTGNDYQPAWSSDGSTLSFVGTKSGRPELYTMAADGSNVTAITTLGGELPDWIPPT